MIRTKHLFIVVVVGICIAIGIGVLFLRGDDTTPPSSMREGVLFSAPHGEYSVIPFNQREQSIERESFIARVREALRNEVPEPTEMSAEPVDTVPAVVAPPVVGTFGYGDGVISSSTVPSDQIGTSSPEVVPDALMPETF